MWRHSSGLPFAAFASLRLSENRRLNEKAHFSQRRKGAAIYLSKTISPRHSRYLYHLRNSLNTESRSFCLAWQAKHFAAFSAITIRSVWLSPLNCSKPQPPVAAYRLLSFNITSMRRRGPSVVTPAFSRVSRKSATITEPSGNRPVRYPSIAFSFA